MTDLRSHPAVVEQAALDERDIVAEDPGLQQVAVVAPSTGRLAVVAALGSVEAGQLLGCVTGGAGRTDEVRAPVAGEATRLLRRNGSIVRRGTAVWWLER